MELFVGNQSRRRIKKCAPRDLDLSVLLKMEKPVLRKSCGTDRPYYGFVFFQPVICKDDFRSDLTIKVVAGSQHHKLLKQCVCVCVEV